MSDEIRAQFPALPDGAAVLFRALEAASRPVDDLTISEWADRHRMVSAESGSPWPGKFRTSRVPYLREPQDCLHPDHPARRVTARWAAQLGKSTAIENWFCYIVDQSPGSMMIVLPTLEEATKFNRVKLQPTIEATPRVDRRLFYVPCPHCGTFQPLTPDALRGPDAEAGLAPHLRCLACDGAILDGHKAPMLEGGVWIATRVPDDEAPVPETIKPEEVAAWACPPCEGRCRDWQPSYHLWAAYAPRERLGEIWNRWQEAEGDTTKLRVFYQQDLALPYDPGGVTIEWERIVEAARAREMPARVVPPGAGLLVSTADVQSYGIKWVVYAIGPLGQRWLIDREVFEGSPTETDEPWIALADALGRTYPTARGEPKGIDLSGIDSGFATHRVYLFCAGRPNLYALDGRPSSGLPWLGTPVKRDVKDSRGRVLTKVMLYPVGAYDVKTEVMAGLANFVQGCDANGAWPRNTLHLPADLTDEALAKELTAERLTEPDEEALKSASRAGRKLISPRAKREWKRLPGRANDFFDATVYAFALAWHLERRRRLTAQGWADLVTQVHGAPPAPDLFTAADEGPFKPKPRPAPSLSREDRKAKWKNRT